MPRRWRVVYTAARGAERCNEATLWIGQCSCLVLTQSASEAERAAVDGVWQGRGSQLSQQAPGTQTAGRLQHLLR